MNIKNIVLNLLFATAAFVTYSAKGNDTVQYSGFAFLGNHGDIEKNFPLTNKINKASDGRLNNALLNKLKQSNSIPFQLNFTQLADLNSSSGLSLAFALERESISIEKIGEDYKLLVSIFAQILIYDFSESSLVMSYPIRVEYSDVKDVEPDSDYLIKIIERIYFEDNEVNVFNLFLNALETQELTRKVNARVQVSGVNVEERAFSALPPRHLNDIENYKNFVAQSFTQFLATNQNVSVLPYSIGEAIGNKMAGRFANGEVFNLVLPEADYEIELSLRGFKKVKFSENNIGEAWIYGSYINLKLLEPLSGSVYFDHNVKNGATKAIPKEQLTVDDWTSYETSLFGLFDSLTKVLSSPTKQWAAKHLGKKDFINSLEKFKEVMEKCM